MPGGNGSSANREMTVLSPPDVVYWRETEQESPFGECTVIELPAMAPVKVIDLNRPPIFRVT